MGPDVVVTVGIVPPSSAAAGAGGGREDARWRVLSVLVVALLHLPVLALDWVNGDDLGHAAAASRILAGEWHVARDVLLQDNLLASLRPLPYVLWMLEELAFGAAAAPRYAVNLVLHLLLVSAVFDLVRCLRGAGAGPGVALVAVIFGSHLVTDQGTRWLAARDDQLAAWFGCLFLLRCARGQPAGGLTVMLWLASLLSKPSALLLPMLVPVLCSPAGVGAEWWRSLRRTMAPYLVLWATWALALAGTVQWDEMLSEASPRWDLAAALARPAELLFALIVGAHGAVEPGTAPLLADLSRGALLVALLIFGRARFDRRLLRLGAFVLVTQMLVPLPMWISADFSMRDSGRYLLLPAIGVALLWAAVVPASLGRRGAAAGITAVALAFAVAATPTLAVPRSGAGGLLRALVAADEDARQGSVREVFVGLKRVDAGILAVLSDPVLRTRVPSLRGRVHVFVEGQGSLHVPLVVEGLHYGDPPTLPAEGTWSFVPPVEGRLVLVDRFLRTGGAEQPKPAWVRVRAPAVPTPPGEPLRWDFGRDAASWAGFALPPPRFEKGRGFRLDVVRRLDLHALTRELQVPPHRTPAFFRSPALDVDPRAYCELRLEFETDAVAPESPDLGDNSLIGTGRFAAALWSNDAEWADPWSRFLLVPLPARPGLHRAQVRLDHAPSFWLDERLRGIGVMPSNEPGAAVLRSVELLPCGG